MKSLYLKFEPDAVRRLHQMQRAYKEASVEVTIARALGLLEVIQPYLHDEHSLLTVVDPNAEGPNREVELYFGPGDDSEDADDFEASDPELNQRRA